MLHKHTATIYFYVQHADHLKTTRQAVTKPKLQTLHIISFQFKKPDTNVVSVLLN